MDFRKTGLFSRGAAAGVAVLACSTVTFGQEVVGGWEGSAGRGYTFV